MVLTALIVTLMGLLGQVETAEEPAVSTESFQGPKSFDLALELIVNRQIADATEVLEAVVAEHPDDLRAVELLESMGRYVPARTEPEVPTEVSLPELYERAVRRDPAVRKAVYETVRLLALDKERGTILGPDFSISVSHTPESWGIFPELENGGTSGESRYQAVMTLSQPIVTNWFKRYHYSKLSGQELAAAKRAYEAAKNQVALAIAQSYHLAQGSQGQQQHIERAITLARARADAISDLNRQHLAEKTKVLEAKTQLIELQERLAEAQAIAEQNLGILRRKTELPLDQPLVPSVSPDLESLAEEDVSGLISRSLAVRPEIRLAEANAETERTKQKLAWTDYPRTTIAVSYRVTGEERFTDSEGVTLRFGVSFPVLAWREARAKAQQARAVASQADMDKVIAEHSVADEVQGAVATTKKTAAALQSAEARRELARENLRETEAKFQWGEFTAGTLYPTIESMIAVEDAEREVDEKGSALQLARLTLATATGADVTSPIVQAAAVPTEAPSAGMRKALWVNEESLLADAQESAFLLAFATVKGFDTIVLRLPENESFRFLDAELSRLVKEAHKRSLHIIGAFGQSSWLGDSGSDAAIGYVDTVLRFMDEVDAESRLDGMCFDPVDDRARKAKSAITKAIDYGKTLELAAKLFQKVKQATPSTSTALFWSSEAELDRSQGTADWLDLLLISAPLGPPESLLDNARKTAAKVGLNLRACWLVINLQSASDEKKTLSNFEDLMTQLAEIEPDKPEAVVVYDLDRYKNLLLK